MNLQLLTKNNILYILLIISLIFLFFNPSNGIIALMKNQRLIINQEKEISSLNNDIKKLKKTIAIVADSIIHPSNMDKFKAIMKEKGIIIPKNGESWYKIEEKKALPSK